MNLSFFTDKLPFLAVAAGVLLLAWSQRSKILGYVAGLWPSAEKKGEKMTPAKRFKTYYVLRTWCKEAGYDRAVISLDNDILPVIVRAEGPLAVFEDDQ